MEEAQVAARSDDRVAGGAGTREPGGPAAWTRGRGGTSRAGKTRAPPRATRASSGGARAAGAARPRAAPVPIRRGPGRGVGGRARRGGGCRDRGDRAARRLEDGAGGPGDAAGLGPVLRFIARHAANRAALAAARRGHGEGAGHIRRRNRRVQGSGRRAMRRVRDRVAHQIKLQGQLAGLGGRRPTPWRRGAGDERFAKLFAEREPTGKFREVSYHSYYVVVYRK